jgi:thiol-disulfide isomerase/thioredoxin
MKQLLILAVFLIYSLIAAAQLKLPAAWRACLVRQDSNSVVFDLKAVKERKETVLYITNAVEKIRISPVKITRDSVNFSMPVFESEFKTAIQQDGSLKGTWFKGTAGNTQQWPFTALPRKERFELSQGNAKNNIGGKWSVTITRANGTKRSAVAEFSQKGNYLTGTFLTPSGDYRYLQGVVTGNLLLLSTFDGAHAYTFKAKVQDANTIVDGFFGSGFAGVETWEAERNEKAALPETNTPQLKQGFTNLDFRFKDLDGNYVSINDDRFKNKAVIIQIMGSWCPNCMDETKFLSEFYSKNKERGLEVISLGYEYSTDFERSQKSLKKFQKLFDVKYPMLITGVSVNDSLLTEKTLPQITEIKVYPTTIFLDKKGIVKKIHSGYYGPASRRHYEEFKKEFYKTVEELLKD